MVEPVPEGHVERPGAAFERLCAAVQSKLDPGSKVRWNEKLNGRQIDATVRGRIGSSDVLVIVECREYKDVLGIDHVDQLDSVREEVGASKAILVARVGFTAPALAKAAKVGIDTCVLRPSTDDDRTGPGKRLQSMSITIQHISTTINDLEVELVDGRRFPCDPLYELEDQEGKHEFIDRIMIAWLQTEGRDHPDGQPLHVELKPPPKLLLDHEEPLVARLHCVPRTGPSGFNAQSLWEAPEEWAFVQHLPDGPANERHFFEFPDLQNLAETLRIDDAARQGVR
jgi:hypothetical protein